MGTGIRKLNKPLEYHDLDVTEKKSREKRRRKNVDILLFCKPSTN